MSKNIVEKDHRAIKRITRPMLGFKSFRAARDRGRHRTDAYDSQRPIHAERRRQVVCRPVLRISRTTPSCVRSRWRNRVPLCIAPANATQPTTIAKRMHAKLAELKISLWRAMHWTVSEAGRWLASVLRGYYQYHAVPGNLRRLYAIRWRLMMCWWRILRRRSQRHRMPWERFFRLANKWLPEPRVVHPYPDARFRAKYSR